MAETGPGHIALRIRTPAARPKLGRQTIILQKVTHSAIMALVAVSLANTTVLFALESVVQGWGGVRLAPARSLTLLLADEAMHALTAVAVLLAVGIFYAQQAPLSLLRWDCLLLAATVAFAGVAGDVDHFWQAGSLDVRAASSLGAIRPPLHCFPVGVALAAAGGAAVRGILASTWQTPPTSTVHWAVAAGAAWALHLARDGTRRGIWFWPTSLQYSTPALPWVGYWVLVTLLPLAAAASFPVYKRDRAV